MGLNIDLGTHQVFVTMCLFMSCQNKKSFRVEYFSRNCHFTMLGMLQMFWLNFTAVTYLLYTLYYRPISDILKKNNIQAALIKRPHNLDNTSSSSFTPKSKYQQNDKFILFIEKDPSHEKGINVTAKSINYNMKYKTSLIK